MDEIREEESMIILNNKGFTFYELLHYLGYLFLAIIIIGGIPMGNQWYSETSVLRKIQINHPKVARIVDTHRNIFRRSVFTVEENGQRKKYYLDSSILLNYEISE